MIFNSYVNRGHVIFDNVESKGMLGVLGALIKNELYSEKMLKSVFSNYSIYYLATSYEQLESFIDLISDKGITELCNPSDEYVKNGYLFNNKEPEFPMKYIEIEKEANGKYKNIADSLDKNKVL